MSPVLQDLLKACNVQPSAGVAKRRLAIRCRNLCGYIQTHGITTEAFYAGKAIAAKARDLLPAKDAAPYQKLATLKEDMPSHWNFVDLAAHISHIGRQKA